MSVNFNPNPEIPPQGVQAMQTDTTMVSSNDTIVVPLGKKMTQDEARSKGMVPLYEAVLTLADYEVTREQTRNILKQYGVEIPEGTSAFNCSTIIPKEALKAVINGIFPEYSNDHIHDPMNRAKTMKNIMHNMGMDNKV